MILRLPSDFMTQCLQSWGLARASLARVGITTAVRLARWASSRLSTGNLPPMPMAAQAEVDAFPAAGVANGGVTCEDPPGVREGPSGKMYLAYLRDPDGTKF